MKKNNKQGDEREYLEARCYLDTDLKLSDETNLVV